jgi:malate synthase
MTASPSPSSLAVPDGVGLRGPARPGYETILTREALAFVRDLHREFEPRRRDLLRRRAERQRAIDAGARPDFLPETERVRSGDWRVAPIPPDLVDRRVEITGPVDRKMIINALNSGANVFMADFEDANAPTWANCVEGQIHLRDAVRGTIAYTSPEGKRYALAERTATLLVRPRGWHLPERHCWVDGAPVSASLFDFGLFFFHNARALVEKGTAPYFYLPKLQSHLEARLWNDVFLWAQDRLGIPRGTVRATVLIEHVLAAFEEHEILYEMREHAGGLNCGRWDYIFSLIKTFRNDPDWLLPDRAQVTMTTHLMRSYSLLTIQTCHRRGIHAIGGMAAQIPVKDDPAANEAALAKVRADKEREAGDGHDGTWVAHPGLVPVAREVFDRCMPGPNQIDRLRDDVTVTARDLLRVPEGTITEEGVRRNIDIAVRYLEAWLGGTGCVPIYHLMEDTATAEICRAQLWQWVHHPDARLDDGRRVTADLVRAWLPEELAKIRREVGETRYAAGHYGLAARILERLVTADEFPEFLTLAAYDRLD